MQDPAAGIFYRILRERGLQPLREQINHLLPAFCRAVVAQVHEQARFVRRFEKTSVRNSVDGFNDQRQRIRICFRLFMRMLVVKAVTKHVLFTVRRR